MSAPPPSALTLANARLVTLTGEGYGLIERGWLRIEDGRIAALGEGEGEGQAEGEDMGGRLVTPALIDCHTHLVFGGDRAREF
ncbi:Amidohydrolase, partial [Paracoccus chinensis]